MTRDTFYKGIDEPGFIEHRMRTDSIGQLRPKEDDIFFDPDGLPLPSRSDQSTTIPNRFLGIVRQVIATISRIEENADRKQLLRELLKG